MSGMQSEDHYIVSHTVMLAGGKFLSRKTFMSYHIGRLERIKRRQGSEGSFEEARTGAPFDSSPSFVTDCSRVALRVPA